MQLDNLVRQNILNLKPYSSARDEYKGNDAVFLDANESPYNFPYNRYPDPQQRRVKEKISKIKKVDDSMIFLGNGSDEAIDLLFRIFCEPGIDNCVTIKPSYGMYKVCADINNVAIKEISLNDDFSLSAEAVIKAIDKHTKLIFLCSPNNPTGNLLDEAEVVKIIKGFKGIVVVDEAYIDFSISKGFLPHLDIFPNLVVLQTFSKAWGLAGVRLGMAFADASIISLFNKVKYPYNVNVITQGVVLGALKNSKEKDKWVLKLMNQRDYLMKKIEEINYIEKVYATDANFFLVKLENPRKLYDYLVEKKIIVRDRSSVHLTNGCLRITVGSKNENKLLIKALKKFEI
jgi:histidinol-phosphate aminotransferase